MDNLKAVSGGLNVQRVEVESFRVIGLEIETPDLGRKVRESVKWIRERMSNTDVWDSPDIHCVVPPQMITADKPGFKLFVGVRAGSTNAVPDGWSFADIPKQTYARTEFAGYLSECDGFYRHLGDNLRIMGYDCTHDAISFERYPHDKYNWDDDEAFQTIHIYSPLR
jgi:predicted transcriptional regulator YdeE